MGILRTDPDPQPSSDIIFGRVKEKERREWGRRRRKAKLCICRSAGTENQPDTTALGDTTALQPPQPQAGWSHLLFLSRLPPSLQLFFLLRLLFSFGPSSNIRDGKLTVHQEEEKAVEEEALPLARASRRRGGQQGQKSRIGVVRSLVAPPPVPMPTTPLLTLLVAPERERGEGRRRRRERDSGQPWWSVNESTNDD